MLTYKTLGIAKPTIRPPISYPIRSVHIWYFLLYKNHVFSSLAPTIDIMQIFVVKGQTNLEKSVILFLVRDKITFCRCFRSTTHQKCV
jgi:hypothetical protein